MTLPGTGPRPDGAATARVKAWTSAALRPDDTRTILVTELACTEPDCPPVETVIAVLGDGEPQRWKLHKPVAAVTRDDVRDLLATQPAPPTP
jgi:hypothetical protein